MPARLVLTHEMIFASLAEGLMAIPFLGLAAFAGTVFRAANPGGVPVHVRHPEDRPSTQVR